MTRAALPQQGAVAREHVRELTLHALKKRINQFREEIAGSSPRRLGHAEGFTVPHAQAHEQLAVIPLGSIVHGAAFSLDGTRLAPNARATL